MSRTAVAGLAVLLAVLTLALEREQARGTFDAVDRGFLAWLAANSGDTGAPLPPLTLVLYDQEALELAGVSRLAVLDGALFARATSRLGAVAAGIEGLQGDPLRMIEAAQGMPVFGGYEFAAPPGEGWTPLRGKVQPSWSEAPGLIGRLTRFGRGFFAPPPPASGGARPVALVARNAGQPVPSFLVLAWARTQGWRISEMVAEENRLTARGRSLPLDAAGQAWFLPGPGARILRMNELLVAAEKFEREGGRSPVEGHLVVLGRATGDITRVAGDGVAPATPAELWADAWEAVRSGRLFLRAGWWLPVSVATGALLLALSAARRSNAAAAFAGLSVVLCYLLAALGAFGASRLLLPLAPATLTVLAALVAGRVWHRAGWLGK